MCVTSVLFETVTHGTLSRGFGSLGKPINAPLGRFTQVSKSITSLYFNFKSMQSFISPTVFSEATQEEIALGVRWLSLSVLFWVSTRHCSVGRVRLSETSYQWAEFRLQSAGTADKACDYHAACRVQRHRLPSVAIGPPQRDKSRLYLITHLLYRKRIFVHVLHFSEIFITDSPFCFGTFMSSTTFWRLIF